MKPRGWKWILLLALTLRVAMLAATQGDSQRVITPDSVGYIRLADNLGGSRSFQLDGWPETFRTPGYPAFLLPSTTSTRWWWLSAACAQILLDVGLVMLTFAIGRRVCGERVGWWGAAILAASPLAIVSSVRILSDSLFTFLVALAILLLVRHFQEGSWRRAAYAAVVAAAACYVRPVGVGFCALTVLVLLAARWRSSLVFAVVTIACLSPWVVRNGTTAGYWGFSSVFDETLYLYSAPALLGQTGGGDLAQCQQEMHQRLHDATGHRHLSPGERANERGRLAKQVIAQNPVAYLRMHLYGDLAVWLPPVSDVLEIAGATTGEKGTIEVMRRQGLFAAIRNYFGDRLWLLWLCLPIAIFTGLQLLLAAIGAVRTIRLRMPAMLWLMTLAVPLFTLPPGPCGHPRFREPIEPILSLAAAAGLVWLLERRKKPHPQGIEPRA